LSGKRKKSQVVGMTVITRAKPTGTRLAAFFVIARAVKDVNRHSREDGNPWGWMPDKAIRA
jgi:hypothetical protein